ncbi:MAG: hypothetical protein ABSC94_04425 [Polyangiaceae bacterium]|jgi:hypothetical protein
MGPAPVRIVEWYRTDPWPQMRRVLLAGPVILTLGGVVIAASFLARASTDLRACAAAVGFVLIAGSAVLTVLALHQILRDDGYLSIRTDGVALQASSSETLVVWDQLVGARWDAARSEIVIERAGDDVVVLGRPFAGVTGPALAQRIEQARRRAALGLLR